jgi:glutamate transport system substrate-binding protein
MRVRRLAAVMTAAALTVAMAGCGGDDGGSTLGKAKKAKKLKVGTKFDQPGFGQKNPSSGKVEGFDVEIAKIIAAEMGIAEDKIEFVEAVSANREPFIQQNKVDLVVATYTINDKRKEVISFAGPYYIAGQDIMVKKGNPKGIKTVADLNGKRVCSVTGSTSEKNLKEKASGAKLTLFKTYSECAEDLRNDKVDAVSTDNVILIGLIAQSPNDFELVGDKFTDEPYGIGVKKDDKEFRDFINATLEKAYADGRWKAAYDKTVGTLVTGGETPTPPAVNRYWPAEAGEQGRHTWTRSSTMSTPSPADG